MQNQKKKREREKTKETEIFGGLERGFSLPKQLHHSSVVLRLLGQLLRLGHLHHLPQQVEGQVQGDWRVLGPSSPLHGLVTIRQAAYERPDVSNFALQEAPRLLELQRSVEEGRRRAGVQGPCWERVRVPVSQPDEILLSQALQNGTRLLLLLLGVLGLGSWDAQGAAWALNSPTFVAR